MAILKKATYAAFAAILGLSALTQSARAEDPLRIGITIWPGWMPWWIVEEKGFFEKTGANAELIHFKRHPDGLAAFAAKQLDAHHVNLADVVVQGAAGVPGKVVLITDMSNGADGILATPEVKSISDFKGRRIATEFGGVSQFLLGKALETADLTFEDVQLVNMSAEDAGAAFLAGAVDVAATWEPYMSQAVNAGKGRIIFSTADTPGLLPDLLIFRTEVIEERRVDIIKVLEAWTLALDFIQSNPEEALEIMARGAGVSPEQMSKDLEGIKLYSIADNVRQMGSPPDGNLFVTARELAAFLRKSDTIDNEPDVSQLIDPSLIQELLQ